MAYLIGIYNLKVAHFNFRLRPLLDKYDFRDRLISEKNDCDFYDQHNISILEKLVTIGMWRENVKIHRVICP